MVSTNILSQALQELHTITGNGLLLLTPAGQVVASYPDDSGNFGGGKNPGKDFEDDLKLFLSSSPDSLESNGVLFLEIQYEGKTNYILAVSGKNRETTGRIACSELHHLQLAAEARNDRNHFIRNVLLDNLLDVDIHNTARRLKIREDVPRTVFLVETSENDNDIAVRTLQAIYTAAGSGIFVAPVDNTHIAVVCHGSAAEDAGGREQMAFILSDTLNAEAMISVRISYGSAAARLDRLSQSYKEARLAIRVGRIFYPDRTVIAYGNLGIGRLIYQLPRPLCELFLKETFDHDVFSELDDETLATIRHFFNNNLNISETARQLYVHRNTLVYRLEKLQKKIGLDIRKFDEAMTFKIAMMVNDYLKNTDA